MWDDMLSPERDYVQASHMDSRLLIHGILAIVLASPGCTGGAGRSPEPQAPHDVQPDPDPDPGPGDPLYLAVSQDDMVTALDLVEQGADPATAGPLGDLVRAAALGGRAEALRILLLFDPTAVDGCELADLAVTGQSDEALGHVLATGAPLFDCDADGLLAKAMKGGDAGVIELLLSNGIEPEGDTIGGASWLVASASAGSKPLVEWLLSKKQDPDDMAEALVAAMQGGQGDALVTLVEHGAKLTKDAAVEALPAFVKAGHEGAVLLCLDTGAKVNALYGDQQTALFVAVDARQAQMVTLLVDKGAKLEIRDQDGWRPIHLAAYRGYVDVLEALLDAGADIDGKDADGKTALAHAAGNGHVGFVQKLVDKGASLDLQDREGKTALVHAASAGYAGCVKLILDAGADPGLVSDTGKDALFYATKAQPVNEEIVDMIEAALEAD